MSALVLHGVPIHWLLKAVILGLLCAFVFRKVGKGADGARSAGFSAVVIVSAVLHSAPGGLMGVSWCIARAMDFEDEDATPTKLKHFLSAAVRLLWPIGAAAVCHLLFGKTWALAGAVAGVIGYLGWAAWYGDKNDNAEDAGRPINPTWNALVERGQGLVAGLSFSIALSATA